MLKHLAKIATSRISIQCKQRNFSTFNSLWSRVTVIGMGGVGQALSIMLKMNPRVTSLHLYDIKDVEPFVVDLNHIDRFSKVVGFCGKEKLDDALKCTNILVITAGCVRTDLKQLRDQFLTENAKIVGEIVEAAALECPQAFIVVVTNPVNSLVPMASEILKKYKVYDPKRLFGLSLLDTVRAKSFLGDVLMRDPTKIQVPVLGGHSSETLVPVFSQCHPPLKLDPDDQEVVIQRIKCAAETVINARKGQGSAQLCTAYAGKLLCEALLAALENTRGIYSTALIASELTKVPFFSSMFYLNDSGISEIPPLPIMTKKEEEQLECALKALATDIKKGLDVAKKEFGGPPKESDPNKKC